MGEEYIKYLDELRRVGRARGCRFLGLDAEAQGRLGEGLGWMKLASEILTGEGSSSNTKEEEESSKKKSLASRFKSSSSPSSSPSSQAQSLNTNATSSSSSSIPQQSLAGGLPYNMDPCTLHSELQTILALTTRWSKTNDKLIFDRIPPTNSLMARIPSGREVHTVPEFVPDRLGAVEVGELRKGGGEGAGNGGGGGGEGYVERWGEETETARDSSGDEDGAASARSRARMPGAYY